MDILYSFIGLDLEELRRTHEGYGGDVLAV
jgi:hypothetical protein